MFIYISLESLAWLGLGIYHNTHSIRYDNKGKARDGGGKRRQKKREEKNVKIIKYMKGRHDKGNLFTFFIHFLLLVWTNEKFNYKMIMILFFFNLSFLFPLFYSSSSIFIRTFFFISPTVSCGLQTKQQYLKWDCILIELHLLESWYNHINGYCDVRYRKEWEGGWEGPEFRVKIWYKWY